MNQLKSIGYCILVWIIFIGQPFAQVPTTKTPVHVWSYYESLPFKTDSTGAGLSQDLVELLNQQSNSPYDFQLEIIPRIRLDYYLQQKHPGMVIFVNWKWMGDSTKQKYLWSHALMKDRNEVVSSTDNPIQYQGPSSLKGLSFAAIRGRRYLGLDTLMEADEIHRRFVNNEGSVLLLLTSGRVQVTSMAKTLLMSHIQKHNLQNKIFISDKPLFTYTRHIMVSKNLPEVYEAVQKFTLNIKKMPKWQAILKKYGLD